MAQHIGIVACSAEGAALCYRTICVEGTEILGRYAHPEVTMHTFPLSEYMRYIESGDWEGVARLMESSVAKVARAGADFAICPDNTIHQAFDLVVERSPIPWLHIAEEVAGEAKRRNYEYLGILGTRFLMEGPVYPTKLDALGIEHRIPGENDRERINEIIFNFGFHKGAGTGCPEEGDRSSISIGMCAIPTTGLYPVRFWWIRPNLP